MNVENRRRTYMSHVAVGRKRTYMSYVAARGLKLVQNTTPWQRFLWYRNSIGNVMTSQYTWREMTVQNVVSLRGGTNIIYHHVTEWTRESHPGVQDLQSTMRLAESWMLQILDTGMGFPSPSRNLVIDYFSPTCKMYQINNEKAINNVDFYPLLAILASTSRDVIIVYVTS